MRRVSRTDSPAFTLIEVLVVLGIILLLAAILLAVFGRAKQSANGTDNLSRLRQLGAAGVLYFEEKGAWPVTASELVVTGQVPKELIHSPRDATVNGIAHAVAEDSFPNEMKRLRPKVMFFDSFPGYGHWPFSKVGLEALASGGSAAGWLVDLQEGKREDGDPWLFCKGSYQRLTFEGSVVTRHHGTAGTDPVDGPYRTPFLLYTDPTEETKRFWGR